MPLLMHFWPIGAPSLSTVGPCQRKPDEPRSSDILKTEGIDCLAWEDDTSARSMAAESSDFTTVNTNQCSNV